MTTTAARAAHVALTQATYAATAAVLPELWRDAPIHGAVALAMFVVPPLVRPSAPLLSVRVAVALAPLPPSLLLLFTLWSRLWSNAFASLVATVALALAAVVTHALHLALLAPVACRRRLTAVLAALHAALALAAALAPLLAAAAFAAFASPAPLFAAIAVAHTTLLLISPSSSSPPSSPPTSPSPSPSPSAISPASPPLLRRVADVAPPLLATLSSAASAAFLRPHLAALLAAPPASSAYLYPSLLFSLHALVAFFAETLVPPLLVHRVSLRSAVLVGLFTSLTGFVLLLRSAYTPAVLLIALGSSVSLVLAVSDLSVAAASPFTSVCDPLAVLSARTFALGELVGILIPALLTHHFGFSFAVLTWCRFLALVAVLLLVPYLFSALAACCYPLRFLLATTMSSATAAVPDETAPLLPHPHNVAHSPLTLHTAFPRV
eukprot:gb/GEZJ01003959.1/.p1 GENE.gb/GEZJ01003959.1/~~gb/GEZJ01003959.1/.p1  ORF type:complete len:437 (+),score=66.19 gb/GEZJ01003959.1/:368-1678(+)